MNAGKIPNVVREETCVGFSLLNPIISRLERVTPIDAAPQIVCSSWWSSFFLILKYFEGMTMSEDLSERRSTLKSFSERHKFIYGNSFRTRR